MNLENPWARGDSPDPLEYLLPFLIKNARKLEHKKFHVQLISVGP